MIVGAVIFAAVLASASSSLQFDLEVGRKKCLGEVMGRNEIAKGKYRIENFVEGSRSGLDVKVTGPNGAIEFSQTDAPSGKFAFTASDTGAHKVCFTNGGSQQRRIDFEFLAGSDAKDYADIAKKEHLKPLELELRKVEDRLEDIHREMTYQREREETHRSTNESTNARVVWYSVLTIAAVAVVSVAQGLFLHRFLKKNGFLSNRR